MKEVVVLAGLRLLDKGVEVGIIILEFSRRHFLEKGGPLAQAGRLNRLLAKMT